MTINVNSHPSLTGAPTARKDPVSRRQYYAIQSLDALPAGYFALPPLDKFLIGTFHGRARFLTADGTLVVVDSTDVSGLYTKLTSQTYDQEGTVAFYAAARGHTQIELVCAACDNGNSHQAFYDLDGHVGRRAVPFTTGGPPAACGYSGLRVSDPLKEESAQMSLDTYREECASHTAVIFHLSHTQSRLVFNVLTELHLSSQAGTYKYVNFLHACTAILQDVYYKAGFAHHYSLFFTDAERFEHSRGSDVMPLVIISQFYPVNGDWYLDPGRKSVHKFMHSLDPNFNKPEVWGQQWEDKVVDPAMVQGNDFIEQRMHNITQSRPEIFGAKIQACFDLLGLEVSTLKQASILDLVLEHAPTTYHDLFYWYVGEHTLKAFDVIKHQVPHFLYSLEWYVCQPLLCDDSPGINEIFRSKIAEVLGYELDTDVAVDVQYPWTWRCYENSPQPQCSGLVEHEDHVCRT